MDIEKLNINSGGVPSPKLSSDSGLFAELERLIGCKLPTEYLAFLSEADGGHPQIGCFSILGSKEVGNFFEIDSFYSINNPSVDNLKDVLVSWAEVLGPKKLPIGSDGGGNQIYLDLADKKASVWLYLHDDGGIQLKLANEFIDFLDSLVSNPDFI